MVTALRNFLIKAMGFRFKPLWNLQNSKHKINKTILKQIKMKDEIYEEKKQREYLLRALAVKSLTRSSVDMSRRASKSTPLKLNFLNVLFFGGCPATATSASTSAWNQKPPLIKNKHRLTYRERERERERERVRERRRRSHHDFDWLDEMRWEMRRFRETLVRCCCCLLWLMWETSYGELGI